MYDYHEGVNGVYEEMTIGELRTASRKRIVQWLEHRGFACYDDEPTDLLRQTAIEDLLGDEYE